jgi:hypothetical protein
MKLIGILSFLTLIVSSCTTSSGLSNGGKEEVTDVEIYFYDHDIKLDSCYDFRLMTIQGLPKRKVLEVGSLIIQNRECIYFQNDSLVKVLSDVLYVNKYRLEAVSIDGFIDVEAKLSFRYVK